MAQNRSKAAGAKPAAAKGGSRASAASRAKAAAPVAQPKAPQRAAQFQAAAETGTHPGVARISGERPGQYFTVQHGMLGPFLKGTRVHESQLGLDKDKDEAAYYENINRLRDSGALVLADAVEDAPEEDDLPTLEEEVFNTDSPPTLPRVDGTTATPEEGLEAAGNPVGLPDAQMPAGTKDEPPADGTQPAEKSGIPESEAGGNQSSGTDSGQEQSSGS